MLLLPTEATIEAINGSTDRCHPFHTYDDHNRFRQFWIHTTKHRSQQSRRGEEHEHLD